MGLAHIASLGAHGVQDLMHVLSFKPLRSRWLCLLLVAAVGGGYGTSVLAQSAPSAAPGVASAFEQAASVEVLINLPDPPGPFETRDQRSAAILRAQAELLEAIGSDFVLLRRYRHVPALGGTSIALVSCGCSAIRA